MNAYGVAHDTFVIDLSLEAAAPRVFGAYADVRVREAWAAPGGDAIVYDEADFRAGGTDIFRCGPGTDLKFHGIAVYYDIVVNSRFVFVESIRVGDRALSTAMVTWELVPEEEGTRLRATTQMVSFAGTDMIASAKSGTRAALQNLAAWLSRQSSHTPPTT